MKLLKEIVVSDIQESNFFSISMKKIRSDYTRNNIREA